MTPKELHARISRLPSRAPVTAELAQSLGFHHRKFNVKKAWLSWLIDYNGPGYRGRKDWNRTAEFVYNHLNAPQMVLWLGEVSGLKESEIRRAMSAVLRAQPNLGSQSAAIRKLIPWKRIEFQLYLVKEEEGHTRS